MEAKELRLNNYVNYDVGFAKGYGQLKTIQDGVKMNILSYTGEMYSICQDKINGIELTPEILEKINQFDGVLAILDTKLPKDRQDLEEAYRAALDSFHHPDDLAIMNDIHKRQASNYFTQKFKQDIQ